VTAITPGDFGGDDNTTGQGATLRVDPATGTRYLTINNAALGVADVTATANGTWLDNDGHRLWVPVVANPNQLDYASYGYWILSRQFGQTGPSRSSVAAWAGGPATPIGSIPVAGDAEYRGSVTGIYNAVLCPHCVDFILVGGDVHLLADFAARKISGAMTNMTVSTTGAEVTPRIFPLNEIGFSAGIDASRNLFAGTTSIASNPGGEAALAPDAKGAIAGQFYGPSASEVGAVWTISDGTHRIIGSFGAK
jgi:hypothetical protein